MGPDVEQYNIVPSQHNSFTDVELNTEEYSLTFNPLTDIATYELALINRVLLVVVSRRYVPTGTYRYLKQNNLLRHFTVKERVIIDKPVKYSWFSNLWRTKNAC